MGLLNTDISLFKSSLSNGDKKTEKKLYKSIDIMLILLYNKYCSLGTQIFIHSSSVGSSIWLLIRGSQVRVLPVEPFFGPLVKWLRHRPFTAVTRVRIPYGSPFERRFSSAGRALALQARGQRFDPVNLHHFK